MSVHVTDTEMLDLVNEHDEIIGEVLKVQANQDPTLIHREVAIIIFDEEKRVLLQQRSKNKKVRPGMWAISCAGHVTKGMTPEEAAHMELKEELGFDTKLVFIEKTLFHDDNETHFTYWFIGKYTDEEITIQKDEVEEARFFTEDEIRQLQSDGIPHSKSIEWGYRLWSGEFDEFFEQL